MRPVRRIEGVVAPLLRPNVDTDAIIPSREMKRVSREGLGEGLFAGWRYREADGRAPNPDFVLNQPPYREATVLAAGPNFGCGSSREHAVWALLDHGIRAVVAPGFGAIFERNCYNNGLLPVTLPAGDVERLLAATEADPPARPVVIDLEAECIELPDGGRLAFSCPAVPREMLLNGWDPIDRTLQHGEAIDRFLQADRRRRPWVYPD